ncbi:MULTISPECIES: xanthine dehydrogenase small subunit [unclassified Arthrobacter]|uniref:xanthine dehydrogenase small subunit n=1 Tax=unclassified Arthrobacter TaxID=235627 RepID=UPI001491C8F9|nr:MULTISPECIES: FAD binding domain-containing protein [unclassified Arthrobacter]MBE0009985.1 xanthine dehydrogenase small subunit [Arthrobacter sp. AET 35A]NOJ63842.1 2Fe-2S iron-sulfur cluster binding domain-containing protein [Arthrobacter sp. 147(2020)]
MVRIEVTVNGQVRGCDGVSPHTNLLDWLRDAGLTGSKEGCAEGECGACAVMVSRPDGPDGSRWTSVNACLPPALAFDGQEIVTAEGLGRAAGACTGKQLHPVQQEMAERGGSQCGYCTPGFVCSMAAEYYRPERSASTADESGDLIPDPPDPQEKSHTGTSAVGEEHTTDHEKGPNGFDLHALSGNFCRCTGYRPIRDAAFALSTPDASDPLLLRQDNPAPAARPTHRAVDGVEFVRPHTMAELFRLLERDPDAKLVSGSTDLGVEINLRHSRPALVVAIDRLEPLRTLTVYADRIEIGAALTLSEVERGLHGRVPLLDELFPRFASRLIRNAATFGGNLATGSPIGDSAPVLLALDAVIVLASTDGDREVPLSEYYTGYRQSVRKPGELVRSARIPLPLAEQSAFYKISKRRFDDISSVAVGFAAQLDEGVVSSIRIGVGGIAATPLRARRTEEALQGHPWTSANVTAAASILATEGTPIDDLRASARYRSAMLEQSLLRFFAHTQRSTVEVAR